MQFFSDIKIRPLHQPINYTDNIMLVGSCFTEHIGNHLLESKFQTLQNPSGILFDPLSVCRSLISYIQNKQYSADELFYLNECWHSWQHHSRFSHPDKEVCVSGINSSQQEAHHFLKKTGWLIITLGSSFAYKLSEGISSELKRGVYNEVANCHKATAQSFIKHLCTIEETITALDNCIHQLFHFNANLKIIFTISPVRHIRDGVTENNRSKARLIEAVHHLVQKFERLYYFPAYELVIDVLRDYRFYDIDMVHPNYAATQFVMEKFNEYTMTRETITLMDEIKKIRVAKNHKAFNPQSNQHKKFLESFYQKCLALQQAFPHLNLKDELAYFKVMSNER